MIGTMIFGMLILDNYWWLMLPGVILGLYAQVKLGAAYNHYRQIGTATGISGAESARMILNSAGLTDLPVKEVGGHLTDHYDPRQRALFLSTENYRGQSLAAVGVAAHEAGHALQHQAAYAPLQIRMALVPVTQFASTAVIWITILGMVMGLAKLVIVAILAFAVITLFQAITLPVEFDASRRAKQQLLRLGLIHSNEVAGVSRVLNAAALTYVAAMVQSLFTLLHFLLIARGHSRN